MIQIEETFIHGLNIIHYEKYLDHRGIFCKPLSHETLKLLDFDKDNYESFFSISKKNVLRGMHLQTSPSELKKILFLTNGSVLDVILDVRPKSKTFGKYFTIKLNLLSPLVISIPYGCAHGFLSLEENSIITYFQSGTYEKEYDTGIRYDSFGFEWPVKEPIISQRDKLFQNFDDFKLL